MEELVFAIPTEKLWKLIPFKEKGLIEVDGVVLKRFVQEGLFRKRSELEEDSSYNQIIPYAIISNKESYCLFKRTTQQTEKRLHNKFSLGVGGHMNPINSNEPKEDYLIYELKRELFEEVKLLNGCLVDYIDFIGFINDDTIPVGTVHIGLLYNIHLSNKDIIVNEMDKMTAQWVDKRELAKFYEGMETWTRIIFDDYIR